MNPSSPTWRMWTAERIVEELPGLLTKVERHREAFPEEYQEKNREAVDALRTSPPTLAEIREKTRRQELSTLGFALDLLARRVISEQEVEERLNLFQAAHELFRSVNIAPHHSKPMRQVVTDALQVVLNSEVARIKAGETDAGVVHEAIKALVLSAWDYIPPQLALSINGQLLIELERIRAEGENDGAFDEQKLIRDNIEAVAALEVPQQLAAIQDRWLDIANHVAPVAGRVVTRWRPKTLPDLLSLDVWEQIKQAVGQGDVSALEQTLAGVADDLETNLRLRLDAQAEYRLPISEVRYRQGGPHRDFVAARELLSQQDKQALEKFSALHFHMSNNTFVKEWYAYALTRFGAAGDIHEIIQLLSDAIESPYYRLEKQWTARWNLACALRRLPNRKDQALDALLPVLESDSHSTEAFELCLLWAFEQDREKVLADLLPKSPYYEAHLLAALYAIEQRAQEEEGDDFPDHFRRINRILRNPAHIFPHPTDPLQFSQLDQLTREFVETSMVEAGIEWFRQRVSYEKEYYIFKNWECAAELNDRAGDKAAAWHCYQRLWGCTQSKQNLSPTAKKRVLENILTWAQQNDFEEQAVVMLRQNWQKTAMTENDALLWEARLRITPPPQPPIIIDGITLKPRRSFDEIIQELAGSFEEVAIPDALAKREQDIQQFLEAVRLKRPDTSAAVLGAIREVVRLAAIYTEGVDDQQARKLAEQMRDQLGPLRSQGEKLPFELRGLVRACERAISNMSARVTGAPEIMVSLPEASRAALGRPEPGETYTTRVLIQLSNPSEEVMGEIDMGFIVVSSGVSLQEESIKLDRISPKEKQVVECTLHMNDGVEDEIALRVHVTYKIRGMMGRPAQGMWHIPVRPFGEPIPVTQRYTTGAPVTADRDDLFHGRDEEMARLLAAFEGGQMRRLYFVNGIRRVGKSTLMAQLGGRSNRETLPLLLNLEDALRGREITTVQLVRQLIRTSIDQLQGRRGLPRIFLELPGAEQFALDPPWTVFDNFLKELCNQTKRHHILLCFDEVQWLVKRIGDPNDPLDDGFLSWLRSKIQTGSNIFVVCTGSEAYEEMRKSCPRHPVWGNMEAFNISFVSRAAMDKIATLPVKTDGVVWLSEALDRLWDMTEGHPWLTQILAEKVAERLNKERRRLVGPGDINRAAEQAAADSRIGDLWWNESEGLVTETHRQIAYLLLRQQPGSRVGLPETQLVDLCQNRLGIHMGRYLEEMRLLEVLTETRQGSDTHWRIKGAFLEKYLSTLMKRSERGNDSQQDPPPSGQPLALMLDWENIKISLLKLLNEKPQAQAERLRARLSGAELARRLLEAASRYGVPRQRWAVANWDHASFSGDQAAVRRAGYMADMSGVDKDDASDHVLREKIHSVLRDHPEINDYLIGTGDADFGAVVRTLQQEGKRVVLWATQRAISDVYKHLLTGPDSIRIEWVENLIFEEATPAPARPAELEQLRSESYQDSQDRRAYEEAVPAVSTPQSAASTTQSANRPSNSAAPISCPNPNCREPAREGARYCNKCGSKLSS